MQAERYADGWTIDHTPSAAVATGDVIEIGNNLVAIAERPIAAAELGALATEGVFKFAKDSSDVAAGDSIYWDNNGNPVGGTAGSGAATLTATGNKYLGAALAVAGAAATQVTVLKTKQPAISLNSVLTNQIADPGDAGAIPVTASGSVSLVSSDAETRMLGDPTFVGQELSLGFKTDGGDVVITTASPVNQTGNNTLTFADVGDHLQLTAIEDGADIEWRVVANDGVALSTV